MSQRLLLASRSCSHWFKRLAPVALSQQHGSQTKALYVAGCGAAAALAFACERQRKIACEAAPARTENPQFFTGLGGTPPTRTDPNNFTGRTALVTGAASGLGYAISQHLVAAGAKVVMVDVNKAKLEEAAACLGSANVLAVPCDLRNLTASKETLTQTGVIDKIDLLVNAAGVAINKPLFDITEDVWNLTMDVNARAILFLTQLCAKGMVERRSGSIVNISSQSSTVVVGPGHTCYSVSKAAVDHITRSVAVNLAADNVHGEEGLKKMAAKIPLQRICETENIADVVLFLLSDKASMVTGVTMPVDGGFLACMRKPS